MFMERFSSYLPNWELGWGRGGGGVGHLYARSVKYGGVRCFFFFFFSVCGYGV